MSRKGVSAGEKKTRMLEMFHEQSEIYTFKELEKLAPKLKGIVSQSVKEVLDELVSDNLVTCEKICGTGNYYWSFPSAAGAMKTAAVEKAKKDLENAQAKLKEARTESKDTDKGREDTPERQQLLAELQEQEKQRRGLQAELAAFGAADPIKYERKKRATEVCKEAAQRWTDNTLVLIQHTRSLGMEDADIRLQLGIDEGWDDLPL